VGHFKPRDAEELRTLVEAAAAEGTLLELRGAGTKRGLGRPFQATHEVDLSALAGVTLYEPDELVLTARAGTRLAEIEALLAGHRQQLAFEPPDLGPLYGGEPGQATIGGTLACNLAGPRRIKAGAARDHFLGVVAINGRGERFKAGGRVVKNVTGYDLCKVLAGSHGTLAAMSDVTVKVLPAPEETRTVLAFGLADAQAVDALRAALASEHEVSAAAHLPARIADQGKAVTAVRVEGFPASVAHRASALEALLAPLGAIAMLDSGPSAVFWRDVRDASFFVRDNARAVWRVSVPPVSGPDVAARIAEGLDALVYYDWGGGLLWLGVAEADDAGAAVVRAASAAAGGHATLMRAPEAVRAAVPVFEPLANGLAQLSRRLKESFDPRGILNPGRMYAGA
jgi:glycolate oxidase FAD binding subunit